MGVKQYEPTSPGRRFQTVSDFAEITTDKPEKSLLAPKPNKAGRNNNGRITTRHQGGGNKRRYRIIDFKRNKDGVPAKVATIEYDPNRSARIALLHYVDGEKRYILHPKGLQAWATWSSSGPEADIKPGNALPLDVHPRRHARSTPSSCSRARARPIARSAGTSIQLMGKEGKYAILRMPSSRNAPRAAHLPRHRRRGRQCRNTPTSRSARPAATAGRASVPTVRGTVMNPVDHPHGGGEGKNQVRHRHPVTPWGVPTKGHRTRNPQEGFQPSSSSAVARSSATHVKE